MVEPEVVNMKVIQYKLDHIKDIIVTDTDVAYMRWKLPLFTNGDDLMKVHRNLKIAIKKHGKKMLWENYQKLLQMLFIVDKEMPRFKIPDEIRRDDFAKWDREEKKYW